MTEENFLGELFAILFLIVLAVISIPIIIGIIIAMLSGVAGITYYTIVIITAIIIWFIIGIMFYS